MENKETKSASVAVKTFFKRVWEYIKIAKVELIVMIALFAIDLISKSIINATIRLGGYVTVIPNFLNFRNVHNDGAVFGSDWMRNLFGDKGAQVLFCLLAILATLAFIFIMVRQRKGSRLFRIALGMLAAGAMGNCIDRMVFAYVRDFIEIVYFGLEIFGKKSFYIFNIADAALVVGVILVIVYFIFFYRDKEKVKHAPFKTDGTQNTEVAVGVATSDAADEPDESKQNTTSRMDDEGISDPVFEENPESSESVDNPEISDDPENGEADENEKTTESSEDAP